jgi:hypothetical protein
VNDRGPSILGGVGQAIQEVQFARDGFAVENTAFAGEPHLPAGVRERKIVQQSRLVGELDPIQQFDHNLAGKSGQVRGHGNGAQAGCRDREQNSTRPGILRFESLVQHGAILSQAWADVTGQGCRPEWIPFGFRYIFPNASATARQALSFCGKESERMCGTGRRQPGEVQAAIAKMRPHVSVKTVLGLRCNRTAVPQADAQGRLIIAAAWARRRRNKPVNLPGIAVLAAVCPPRRRLIKSSPDSRVAQNTVQR